MKKGWFPKMCRYSLKRTGLLETLFQADNPVLVFHGKAGYGKTELARQYGELREGEMFWHSFDGSGQDEGEFETWFLKDTGPSLLVLDGLEQIKNTDTLALIRRRIGNLPDKGKLILITGGEIPEFLSRFVLDGTCLLTGEAELAFSLEEQRALAEQILSCTAEEKEELLKACMDVLEGWPAGLLLAFCQMEKQKLKSSALSWPYLFQDSLFQDFLSCEVLSPLSEAEQDFLLRTSGMDELKESICDKALEIHSSAQLIRKLLKKNCLYSSPEDGGVKIRCPKALRLFLSTKIQTGGGREIAWKSAGYYLEEGDYEAAARQAAAAGYTSLLFTLLEIHGENMLNNSQDQLLSLCLKGVEQSVSGQKLPPEFLGLAAQYCYKTGQYEQMEKYLNQADSSFGKENKFGMYRGLYKGLLRYGKDPEKYEKQISNTLFLLEENHCRLPFLKPPELEILSRLEAEKSRKLPGKLNVTCFGEFQVTAAREEKPLSWRTRKGQELFAYLVELDGKAVGRNQLFKQLWSEDLPDNAVTMLHNMLYNIRKELSAYHLEDLIQYKEKRYRINMEKIESDLGEIRHLCALVDQKNAEELRKHKDRFTRYWGRYLEDMDNQWMNELREYYDARFLKGCTLLAEDAAAAGRFQEAVRFLKNALAINSYSEELAGNLLKCYGAMRNLNMVKLEYERFTSLLERDLEMKPGRKLAEIYKEALSA